MGNIVFEDNHGILCNIGIESYSESGITTYVIHIEMTMDNTTASKSDRPPARMSESQMEELNPRTVHHLLLAAVTIAAKTPVFYILLLDVQLSEGILKYN